MTDTARFSKFTGSIIGSCLGDAIGEISFHDSGAELKTELGKRAEFPYTDDSAMSIGIMETLIVHGDIDVQALGDQLKYNYYKEPWRGYAGGPPTIFQITEIRKVSYPRACKILSPYVYGNSRGSMGNGSAMRIAPVGVFFSDRPDLYKKARLSSIPTHIHRLAIDGTAVLAKAVALAFKADPAAVFDRLAFLRELERFSRSRKIRGAVRYVSEAITAGYPEREVASHFKCGVLVEESMPFALYSFAKHPESFEQTLYTAVLNGGDSDTIGAMACAVSGAYLGMESIPDAWIRKLENREYIKALCERLYRIRFENSPLVEYHTWRAGLDLPGDGEAEELEAADEPTEEPQTAPASIRELPFISLVIEERKKKRKQRREEKIQRMKIFFKKIKYRLGMPRKVRSDEELQELKPVTSIEGRGAITGNAMNVITPERWQGTWVFDDDARGLVREPFVLGVPVMIDSMLGKLGLAGEQQVKFIFSRNEFPNHHVCLKKLEEEAEGAWYTVDHSNIGEMDLGKGWLCPATRLYFEDMPERIYVRIEKIGQGGPDEQHRKDASAGGTPQV